MTSKFVFDRFDATGTRIMVGSADGEYVRAEDAINREAVNADRIRVLELQLKECQKERKNLVEAVRDIERDRATYRKQLQTLKDRLKDLSV
jgi:chromosome segregation ATPase